ncbi:MAG: hypothetical protein OEV43_00440 [Coriobacteriia bacterium]|nr:hypothetical protein [Coriobacteriia bacterium]
MNPTLRRIPSTLGEDEIVQAPQYLAIMVEDGRAMPFGFTGIGYDAGSITAAFENVTFDFGSITSPSRLPIDFGTI